MAGCCEEGEDGRDECGLERSDAACRFSGPPAARTRGRLCAGTGAATRTARSTAEPRSERSGLRVRERVWERALRSAYL
jgi:hypothetical protein